MTARWFPLGAGLASATPASAAATEPAAEPRRRGEIVAVLRDRALDSSDHRVAFLERAGDDLGERAVGAARADRHRLHLLVGKEHVDGLVSRVAAAPPHAEAAF